MALAPSQINETLMNGLGGALGRMGRRWRRLDREKLKGVLLDLQKRRKDIIRQEDIYPPNDPLRLSFQCQRAIADLHILELKIDVGRISPPHPHSLSLMLEASFENFLGHLRLDSLALMRT